MRTGSDPAGCGIHPLAFTLGCLFGGAAWIGIFKAITALCLMVSGGAL